MAAIDITGAAGTSGAVTAVTATSPVTSTGGTTPDIGLDQTQFKTINGNSIFGAGNIVIATGLTNWTEAYTSNPVGNTSSFTALGAGTNINAAIIPKGTGAIVADIPDGAATGGNARGTYAVDFQMQRNNANQVASGNYSCIISGEQNRVAVNYSAILTGYNNRITSGSGVSAIITGDSNQISGGSSLIGSGYANNIGAFNENFIGSGSTNTISAATSFIGSGYLNNISAPYGAIGGGQSNTVSGQWSFIGSGNANVSSGNYSAISGGQNNTASGPYSGISGGLRTATYMHGQIAHASGRFSIDGDAQGSECILSLVSGFTDAQTKELFLDGNSLRITAPSNGAMTVNIDIVAIVTAISGTATGVTVGDMFSQNSICAYKNLAGTGSIVGTPYSIHKLHDASMTACNTAFVNTGSALTVNFLGPNFSGGGTLTLRIVAKARIVETRY